ASAPASAAPVPTAGSIERASLGELANVRAAKVGEASSNTEKPTRSRVTQRRTVGETRVKLRGSARVALTPDLEYGRHGRHDDDQCDDRQQVAVDVRHRFAQRVTGDRQSRSPGDASQRVE